MSTQHQNAVRHDSGWGNNCSASPTTRQRRHAKCKTKATTILTRMHAHGSLPATPSPDWPSPLSGCLDPTAWRSCPHHLSTRSRMVSETPDTFSWSLSMNASKHSDSTTAAVTATPRRAISPWIKEGATDSPPVHPCVRERLAHRFLYYLPGPVS